MRSGSSWRRSGWRLACFDQDLFSAVLVAVLGTTVAAPYLLGMVVPRAIAEAGPTAAPAT